MVALVDANNMYVSCERVFAPRLVGRPVVVLSSNDGACIARSNEAKELGVKMAQPWFQVRHLERTAGLIAVSANFELYSDMSARMMAVAGRYAPRQQVYSIDECFLDFEGVRGELVQIGRQIRAAVLREVGLPTSIGFGATKTLAKLANHVGKTADRKPGSYAERYAQVCDFAKLDVQELETVFAGTDVGTVWGVGRKLSAKLREAGVSSVLEFVRADAAMIRSQFSVVLEKTLLELRGIACLDMSDIDDAPAAKQQILVSRSFGTAITDPAAIMEAVSEFASRAAEKLRHQESTASAIGVFFMTSPFRSNDRPHSVNVTTPLVRPTADSRLLIQTAVDAAQTEFRHGFNYAKAGVILSDLRPASQHQGELDLFADDDQKAPAKDRSVLMDAMDVLNRRFGRDSVRIGSSALASHSAEVRSWATRQERRSPRYTTRWEEMPVVKT